jgi:hypothetical protein
MNRRSLIIPAFLTAVLAICACVADQGIDKKKFAALDRTANDLRSALTTSVPCDLPEDLEQRFAAELAAVQDGTSSKGERDLVAAYAQVLITYRDGLLLCRSQSHLKSLKLIPEGRIVVTQELDPLVEKYGLGSERHVYRPTGQMISSIDTSSIEIIWGRARAQIKMAENILLYH